MAEKARDETVFPAKTKSQLRTKPLGASRQLIVKPAANHREVAEKKPNPQGGREKREKAAEVKKTYLNATDQSVSGTLACCKVPSKTIES